MNDLKLLSAVTFSFLLQPPLRSAFALFPNHFASSAKHSPLSLLYQLFEIGHLLKYPRSILKRLKIICAVQIAVFYISQMITAAKSLLRLRRVCVQLSIMSCFSDTPNNGKRAPLSAPLFHPPASNHHISKESPDSSNTAQAAKDPTGKPIKLSDVAQRAIWASLIIQTIAAPLEDSAQTHQSLRDQILKLKVDVSKLDFDLDDKYKDDVLEMFKGGIHVDSLIFNKERVTEAKLNKKLTFFPTTTVSKKIFEILLMTNQSFVVTASFGIGRTFAYLMFFYLSQYVNKLQYLAYSQWISKDVRRKHREELQMLVKMKLVTEVPKIWYWSMNETLNQNDENVQFILLRQIDSLSLPNYTLKSLIQSKDLDELVSLIRSTYPEQIHQKIVIDQINYLAFAMRKWNQRIDTYDDQIEKNILQEIAMQQLQIQKKLSLHPALKTDSILSSFWQLGQTYIVNSSILLQKNILGMNQGHERKIKISAFKHSFPIYMQIQYSRELKQNDTQKEFRDFFKFHLEIVLWNAEASQNAIKVLRQIFKPESIDIKSYYRILFVRQFFSSPAKISVKDLIKRLQKNDKAEQVLTKISKQFNKFVIGQIRIELAEFINKNPGKRASARRQLIRYLSIEAAACLEKGMEKFTISAYTFTYLLKKFELIEDNSTLYDFLNSTENQKLFLCNYLIKKYIVEFDWSPSEFIEIVHPILHTVEFSSQVLIPQPYRSRIKDKGSVADFQSEGYIIHMLMLSKGAQFSFKVFGYNMMLEGKKEYNFHGNSKFKAFNLGFGMNKGEPIIDEKGNKMTKSLISLSHNLGSLLTQAKDKPDGYIMATPYYQNEQNQHVYAAMSAYFDFLFVKYNTESSIFEITAFNVAISKKSKQQIESAINLLKILLRKVPANRKLSQNSQILEVKQQNLEEQFYEKIISEKKLSPTFVKKQKQESKSKKTQEKGENQIIFNDSIDVSDKNKYRIDYVILTLEKYCQKQKVIVPNQLTLNFYPMEKIILRGCDNFKAVEQFKQFLEVLKYRGL